ncbi:MAG: uracil-DNA glycosylase [Gemmatimonadaceae bacterium]|nr:uracil-DNA glycosylase [Gemmatimonadaceae bacterium]
MKPSAGAPSSGSDLSRSAPSGDPLASSSAPSAASSAASSTPTPAPARSGARATLPSWLEALGIPAGFEAGGVAVRDLSPEIAALPSLQDVAAHIGACQRCALYKTARHPVPGEGNPQAEFLCVGEAPGANEDMQGRPFVGDAGQLLTKILSAIQLNREDVFIHNVLKHRPPGNRDPLPDEVHACQPYLLRQIELVRPRVILALGRFAAQTLLQTTTGIGSLRGQIHRFHGVPLVVTYHPAALLRNEAWKRPTWEDVKLARRVLDAARVAEPTRSSE